MTARSAHAHRPARPHVVVAGGGIAGVEALLALRELAGARISLELVAPGPDLVLRPLAVTEPFGTGEVRRVPLREICEDQDAHLRTDALEFVDVTRRRVETAGGAAIGYDALVVAVGARNHEALPGAVTFTGPASVDAFAQVLADLVDGRAASAAFAVPTGTTWPLPLYELTLMTAQVLAGGDVPLTVVTPERDPLDVFGAAAGAAVRRLLAERGVALRTATEPLRIANRFLLTSGGAVPADRVVALPRIEGPRVPGLPYDRHGFLPVDEHGAVVGAPGVYAAGDSTDSPVKQGGLAAQQADAAAEAIAAAFGAPCMPTPFRPELRAQLLTGTLPLFFRGGETSATPLWWPAGPAGKVAARYLAPYLAGPVRARLTGEDELRDLPARRPVDEPERQAALDLALTLADQEAAAGDPEQALRWLDAAESAAGALPPEYVERRRRWRQATDGDLPPAGTPAGARA